MNYYLVYVCEEDSVRLEPTFIDGVNPLGKDWDKGEPLNFQKNIKFTTYLSKNKLYDWIGGYSWNPFVSESVHDRLKPVLGEVVQWLGPITEHYKTR